MQGIEDKRKIPERVIMELIGLPIDVKQYQLETGWLVVSTVGMCFVPYPPKKVVPTDKDLLEDVGTVKADVSEDKLATSSVASVEKFWGKKSGKSTK